MLPNAALPATAIGDEVALKFVSWSAGLGFEPSNRKRCSVEPVAPSARRPAMQMRVFRMAAPPTRRRREEFGICSLEMPVSVIRFGAPKAGGCAPDTGADSFPVTFAIANVGGPLPGDGATEMA